MFDLSTLLIVAVTFLLAGGVKGVIGLGLPTVSLALLTASLGLTEAMSLLLIPSFITNVWQAFVGGHAKAVLRRIWPFLALATAMIWLGANVLAWADLRLLSALLGVLLVLYALLNLIGFRLNISPDQEIWAGPLMGAINGVLTGMTGSFVVPGVLFLQAIGLSRDMLIQAMGMLFALSTLALGLALQGNGFLTAERGAVSAGALVPALMGMVLGQKIRKRLSEDLFRQVFFAALLILGSYIIARAF